MREKLIELLDGWDCPILLAVCEAESLADYLIANGVTIRGKKRCNCCADGRSFIGQTIILANDGNAHKIHYCPNCGAELR